MIRLVNRIVCFCIIFSLASCSKKYNSIEDNIEQKEIAAEQEYIVIDTNVIQNIDINKILKSNVWNTDQIKIDELTKKFDENKLTENETQYRATFKTQQRKY